MMLQSNSRSLVLCIPEHGMVQDERLKVIASAMKRAALELGLRTEIAYKQDLLSTSILFKTRDGENCVYSDWNKDWDSDLIYKTIRSFAWASRFERISCASIGM